MKWSRLTLLGLLVGGGWLLYTGLGPRVQKPRVPVLRHTETGAPDVRMWGVQLVEQTDTTIAWEVFAEDAALYNAAQYATVHRVRAQLFRDMTPPLYVEADRGRIGRATGDISMYGHVRFRPQEGYTITTEVLHWQATDRLFHTSAPVQISSTAVSVTGKGLRSALDRQQLVLQSDVRASFQLE